MNLDGLTRWRTTLVGVAAILDVPYATSVLWASKLKLSGRRGRKRYGLAELFQYELARRLYAAGFGSDEIRNFLRCGLPQVIDRLLNPAPPESPYMIVLPSEPGHVTVGTYDRDKFALAVFVLAESGKRFCSMNLDQVKTEVRARIRCHLDRVPYTPPATEGFENLKKALCMRPVFSAK